MPSKPRKAMTVSSVFVSILLFIVVTAGLLIITVRTLLSEKWASGFLYGVVSMAEENDLADAVVDSIHPFYKEQYNISRESLGALFEDEKLKEFISKQTPGYINAVKSGDRSYVIQADEVISFIQDNEEIIFRETGYVMTERDYWWLEENLGRYLEDYRLGDILGGSLFMWVRFLLSPATLIVIAALCLGLILLLVITQRRHYRTLVFAGAAFGAAGLIFVICGLCLDGVFEGAFGTDKNILSPIIREVISSGLGAIAAGSVMILAFVAASVVEARLARREKTESV